VDGIFTNYGIKQVLIAQSNAVGQITSTYSNIILSKIKTVGGKSLASWNGH